MINNSSVLALILARGGSKGLPGKNLRALRGKPLIACTVEAAKNARTPDAVVLSTDSNEIATVARDWGVEVPFMRPAELASDTATSIDAMLHAITWLKDQGRQFEYTVLLEPTSPLREASDIDQALLQLAKSPEQAIVSVCRAEGIHPAFMYAKNETGVLRPIMSEFSQGTRRQDVQPVYFLEGTVYASRTESLFELRSFYHHSTLGYEVPKWKSPEIDDEIDFLHVEAIMKHRGIGV